MERLTVLCFGGTYGLALAGELARFAVRGAVVSDGRAHGAGVGRLDVVSENLTVARRLPITTPFESLLVLSWIFAAIALPTPGRVMRSPAGAEFTSTGSVFAAALAFSWAFVFNPLGADEPKPRPRPE